MHFTKLSNASYMYKVHSLFLNSIGDDSIKRAVYSFGYSERKIRDGKSLFDALSAIDNEQVIVNQEKIKLNLERKKLQQKVHRDYMKYIKIARIVFAENHEANAILLLSGVRDRIYINWHFQVNVFCSNLLKTTDYWKELGEFGIHKSQIEALYSNLNELNILDEKCAKITGSLKGLIQKKRKQLVNVQSWVSDYVKIARIALEDAPQHLEKLGIIESHQNKN